MAMATNSLEEPSSPFIRTLAQLGAVQEELGRLHSIEITALREDRCSLQRELDQASEQVRELQEELKQHTASQAAYEQQDVEPEEQNAPSEQPAGWEVSSGHLFRSRSYPSKLRKHLHSIGSINLPGVPQLRGNDADQSSRSSMFEAVVPVDGPAMTPDFAESPSAALMSCSASTVRTHVGEGPRMDHNRQRSTRTSSSMSNQVSELRFDGPPRFNLLEPWREGSRIGCAYRARSHSGETQGVPHRQHTNLDALMEVPKRRSLVASCMVNPISKKRLAWDVLSFFFVAADVLFVPLFFFDMPRSALVSFASWLSGLFWFLDIPVTFLTGIYVNGNLELKPGKVAQIYAKSWLLMDVLILLTQWCPVFLEYTHKQEYWPVMTLVRGARVLRLVRLHRLLKVQMVLQDIGWRFSSQATLAIVGLVKFSVFSVVAVHFIACMWYGIGWSRSDGWVYVHNLKGEGLVRSYMTSLHWAIAQFHGTSPIHPGNLQEYAFSNTVMILVIVLFCYLLAAITNTLMQLDALGASEIRHQQLLYHYLKRNHVSSRLAVQVRVQFLTHGKQRLQEQVGADEMQRVLTLLPQGLQLDIAEEIRAPILVKYSFLGDIAEENPRVIRQLCSEALAETEVQAGEVIFSPGDVASRMIFVMFGAATYLNMRRGSMRTPITPTVDSSKPAVAEVSDESKGGSPYIVKPATEQYLETELRDGAFICEAALWTHWEHCGELTALSHATILALDASSFTTVILRNVSASLYAISYAQVFVKRLNCESEYSDISHIHLLRSAVEMEARQSSKSKLSRKRTLRRLDRVGGGEMSHHIFISHHKAEAGTEAALIQEVLERMIGEDSSNPANCHKAPVFLDSQDLADLNSLKEHVEKSNNLVVLLTNGLLERPWVLIELVTAFKGGLQLVPVEVQKKETCFEYPDEDYFTKLREGKTLSQDAKTMLLNEGISMDDLEEAVRKVFKKIAVPFSPHKSANVRNAELHDILRRCRDAVELN